MLARAVARDEARAEARAEALTPRSATVAVDLLRNEYSMNGATSLPDEVVVEILGEIYLPPVRG